jgi:hypothetical protein
MFPEKENRKEKQDRFIFYSVSVGIIPGDSMYLTRIYSVTA